MRQRSAWRSIHRRAIANDPTERTAICEVGGKACFHEKWTVDGREADPSLQRIERHVLDTGHKVVLDVITPVHRYEFTRD